MNWIEEAAQLATRRFLCSHCKGAPNKLAFPEGCSVCEGKGSIMPVQDNMVSSAWLVSIIAYQLGGKWQVGNEWVMRNKDNINEIRLPFAVTDNGNLQIDEMISELENDRTNVDKKKALRRDRLGHSPIEMLRAYINLCRKVYGEPLEA